MMNYFSEFIYKPINNYRDKTQLVVCSLLFLFPIAGMSIRHWYTSIFFLLLFVALATLRKRSKPLLKEEKIFLWICAVYFLLYVLSATINGWDKPQVRYLERDLRYLAIIPVYLLIRRYPECTNWLFKGGILAGFFLLTQALYDLFVLKIGYANGVYSKNIIGPFSVLITFWLTFYLLDNHRRLNTLLKVIVILSIIGAIFAAAASGSRGAYLGFFVTSLFCIIFFLKMKWKVISICGLVIVAGLFYSTSSIVKYRVDSAITEFTAYCKADDHSSHSSSATSVGLRLEMVRTAYLVALDSPIFGHGPANYLENAKKHIQKGEIHPAVASYPNLHNAFLETLVSKGILGLFALLLLLYYPMYIFIRDYKISKMSAIVGMIHIVAISTFAMTDHSVLIKNNYIAILLLGLSIFLSTHLYSCKKIREREFVPG